MFVGNLSYAITEVELRDDFSQEGRTVQSVRIALDRETQRPRGFAFIEVATDEDAESAIKQWNERCSTDATSSSRRRRSVSRGSASGAASASGWIGGLRCRGPRGLAARVRAASAADPAVSRSARRVGAGRQGRGTSPQRASGEAQRREEEARRRSAEGRGSRARQVALGRQRRLLAARFPSERSHHRLGLDLHYSRV